MTTKKPTLLIPVEHQVRELDAKLLLAYMAARRGFAAIIGPRREMHFHIPSFPKGIYLSKSMTDGSRNVFRMLRLLGHDIVVWDEEALVHLPPEAYYHRRLSPVSMQYVSQLLAWGEENVELWRRYPELPAGVPIHTTGNPRGDLLRPEIRTYYGTEVRQLKEAYGDFILVNTNFNQVNAFFPDMNLLKPADGHNGTPGLSRRALGMGFSRDYAQGLCAFKSAIFEDFQKLIPALEKDFPGHTIVVRPHPAENQSVYQRIADQCRRVRVTNEGNVVPWLMAARVLIHNGCTTGVEAYLLDVPAITYRATVHEEYDNDYHRLPHLLSHQCFDYEQLQDNLAGILAGKVGAADGDKRRALMNYHLTAREGRLACDRMVDVFEQISTDVSTSQTPAFHHRLRGFIWATRRKIKKRVRGYLPNMSHNRPEYLRHRYPDVSMDDVRSRISRFRQILGNSSKLRIERLHDRFFRIDKR
jgi:surface carbohydrate biosynthesis protein